MNEQSRANCVRGRVTWPKLVGKHAKMAMFTLVVFLAFLTAIPTATLAQDSNKNVQANACDQVDFTKKWQCEAR
jgi:hypothetical protein